MGKSRNEKDGHESAKAGEANPSRKSVRPKAETERKDTTYSYLDFKAVLNNAHCLGSTSKVLSPEVYTKRASR